MEDSSLWHQLLPPVSPEHGGMVSGVCIILTPAPTWAVGLASCALETRFDLRCSCWLLFLLEVIIYGLPLHKVPHYFSKQELWAGHSHFQQGQQAQANTLSVVFMVISLYRLALQRCARQDTVVCNVLSAQQWHPCHEISTSSPASHPTERQDLHSPLTRVLHSSGEWCPGQGSAWFPLVQLKS